MNEEYNIKLSDFTAKNITQEQLEYAKLKNWNVIIGSELEGLAGVFLKGD